MIASIPGCYTYFLLIFTSLKVCLSAADPGVIPVYQHREKWQDHTFLLSAAQTTQPATAACFLSALNPRLPTLIVIGDLHGSLHLLTSTGAVLGSFSYSVSSGITAITSLRLARNVTVVLTGHQSGEVRLFLVNAAWLHSDSSFGAQDHSWDASENLWDAQQLAGRQVDLELLSVLSPQQLLCSFSQISNGDSSSCPAFSCPGAKCSESDSCQPNSKSGQQGYLAQSVSGCPAGESGAAAGSGVGDEGSCSPCAPITHLSSGGRRGPHGLVTVVSAAGGVAVVRLEGKHQLGGVKVIRQLHAGTPVLAARTLSATLTLLGPAGIAALPAGAAGPAAPEVPPPQWNPCVGLGDSPLVAAAFQDSQGFLAYGLTQAGDVAVLAINGNGGKRGCQVKSAVKAPPAFLGSQDPGSAPPLPQPPTLSLIKGYLLLSTPSMLAVYNVSEGLSRRPPQLVLTQRLSELPPAFMPTGRGGQAHSEAWGFGAHPTGAAAADAELPSGQLPSPWEPPREEQGLDPLNSEALHDPSEQQQAGVAQARREAFSPGQEPPAGGMGGGGVPTPPWVVSDGGQLVAVGFGQGLVAVYRSMLPLRAKPPPPVGLGFLQMLQPVLLVGVAGVVVYRSRHRRSAEAGLGAFPGGRDSMREFERLLQGGSGGRKGAFGRFDSGSDGEEPIPYTRVPASRKQPSVPPSTRAKTSAGSAHQRRSAGGSGSGRQQPTHLQGGRRPGMRGIRSPVGAEPDVAPDSQQVRGAARPQRAQRGHRVSWVSSPEAPSAVPYGDKRLPPAPRLLQQQREAGEGQGMNGAEVEGGGWTASEEGPPGEELTLLPGPQLEVDYAPLPGSGAGEGPTGSRDSRESDFEEESSGGSPPSLGERAPGLSAGPTKEGGGAASARCAQQSDVGRGSLGLSRGPLGAAHRYPLECQTDSGEWGEEAAVLLAPAGEEASLQAGIPPGRAAAVAARSAWLAGGRPGSSSGQGGVQGGSDVPDLLVGGVDDGEGSEWDGVDLLGGTAVTGARRGGGWDASDELAALRQQYSELRDD